MQVQEHKTQLRGMLLTQPQVTYIGHRHTAKGLKADPNNIKAVRDMPTALNVTGCSTS